MKNKQLKISKNTSPKVKQVKKKRTRCLKWQTWKN